MLLRKQAHGDENTGGWGHGAERSNGVDKDKCDGLLKAQEGGKRRSQVRGEQRGNSHRRTND